MYHTTIHRRIREERRLHSATLELTYRCDLDCFFCYNDDAVRGESLDMGQYRSLLADLAKMQVLFVTLTGGEPLVHPRFFDIGRAAKELGFVIRIRTNGHSLSAERAARVKDEIAPYLLEISLHGSCADTHDRQTRHPGSFDRLMDNVYKMKEIGLRISFVSTLTQWNENEIEAMFALADKLEVNLKFQGPVGPRENGDTEPLSIQPAPASWEQIARIVEMRKTPAMECERTDAPSHGRAEKYHCGTGSEEVVVDPFGNVYPCLHLRWSAGNLHRETIEKIWNDSPVFQKARDLSADTVRQWDGKKPTQLGAPMFCPALALRVPD